MASDALLQQLAAIPGVSTRAGEPLSAHTPLRVGGPAQIWAIVADPEALKETLSAARAEKIRWRVLWPLEDLIFRDAGYNGLIIRPGRGFEGVSRLESGALIGAGTPWAALSGLVELPITRWSGTVGGLFSQGEQGRLTGLGLTLSYLKGRRLVEVRSEPGEAPPALKPSEIPISLRNDPTHPGRRRLRPPPRPGQLFAAPRGTSPGEQLLRTGLTGTRLRDWRLSETEPGSVVQIGHGTCRDVELLARGVVERVQRARGVELSLRIPVIGARS
jgi:UDP-N-acetylmuramate dehydrogenase